MTTQANPDGQTQQGSDAGTGGTGEGAATPEPWRNAEDARKAFAARDKYKTELEAAQKRLADLEARERDAGKSENEKKLAEAERRAIEAENKARETEEKLTGVSRNERRREIVDAILSAANPQVREELGLMLDGLHNRGELDLYAEDAKAEGKKALDKLRKRLPSYFTPDGAGNGAHPSGPGRDYSGVDWMQLSAEEQRNVSQEDFRKHFAGRGAGRRGRGSALFGNTTTTPRK